MRKLRLVVGVLGILFTAYLLFQACITFESDIYRYYNSSDNITHDDTIHLSDIYNFAFTQVFASIVMLIASIICVNKKVNNFGIIISLIMIHYVVHINDFYFPLCIVMSALLIVEAVIKIFKKEEDI